MRKKSKYGPLVLKVLLAVLLSLVLTVGIVFLIASVKHKQLLEKEKQYLTPPGEMVEVNGHQIHVVHAGDFEAEHTLVFLHSNKAVDDSIALQPLFEELTDYNLIYVDRSGVGFSEDWDAPKDVDSMLEETRNALKAVTDKESFILVATKSAGVIALDWAEKYPDEIEAIVGMEMYLPDQYSNLDDDAYCSIGNRLLVTLVKNGAHRYADSVYPTNDFSLYTEKQMNIRNALVSKSLYTRGMYNEDKMIVKNAKKVSGFGWPKDIPMCLMYANPFMDPYLHDNQDMVELYNQVSEQGEEYDCVAIYNQYYKEYLDNFANVKFYEISGPEQLIIYNPQNIAKIIKSYTQELN